MKQLILIVLLLISVQGVKLGYNCSVVLNNDAFYNLEKLQDDEKDYTQEIKQQLDKDKDNYEKYDGIINYNFCGFSQGCPNDPVQTYAAYNIKNQNQTFCYRLTSESVYSDVQMKLIDKKDPALGLKVILPGGDIWHAKDGHVDGEALQNALIQNNLEQQGDNGATRRFLQLLQQQAYFTQKYQNNLKRIRMLDEDNENKSTNLTLQEDRDQDGERDILYQIEFIIWCDKKESSHFKFKNYTHVDNTFVIEGHSKKGCPTLELSALWKDMSDQKVIFGLFFLTMGGYLCFFGNKYRKITLYIAGFFFACASLVVVMGEFVIDHDTDSKIVVVSLIISVCFGFLFGFMTLKLPKLGVFILGCLLGLMFSLLIHNTILFRIDNLYLIYIVLLVIGLGFGVAGFWIRSYITILSTSFCGAYMLIRPFGWWVGHFPNEFSLVKEIKYHIVDEISEIFYLYVMLILLLTGIGIKFQLDFYKWYKEQTGKDLEEELLSEGDLYDDFDEDESENSIQMEVIKDKSMNSSTRNGVKQNGRKSLKQNGKKSLKKDNNNKSLKKQSYKAPSSQDSDSLDSELFNSEEDDEIEESVQDDSEVDLNAFQDKMSEESEEEKPKPKPKKIQKNNPLANVSNAKNKIKKKKK